MTAPQKHPREALRAVLPKLKGTAAQVFLCLVAYSDDQGECWPAVPTIAQSCGLKDLRAVRTALGQLVTAKLIRGVGRPGRTTTWRLGRDWLPALPSLEPLADDAPDPSRQPAPLAPSHPGSLTQTPLADDAPDPSRQPHHEVCSKKCVPGSVSTSSTSTPPTSSSAPSAPPARAPRRTRATPPEIPLEVAALMAAHENSRRLALHQPALTFPVPDQETIDRCRNWLAAKHTPEQVQALIDFANADRKWHQRLSRSLKYIAGHWASILGDLLSRGTPEQQRAFAAPAGSAGAAQSAPSPAALSAHDRGLFRNTTFNEWQRSVAMCAQQLRREDFESDAAFFLAAQRAASERSYRWEMDPPPSHLAPGSYPWRAWR